VTELNIMPLYTRITALSSQYRTVVLHCCKGDAASQWKMTILGVSELRNPWTDRLKIWHTWLRRWVDLIRQIS